MFLLNNGGVQESLHTAEWWFGNFSFSTLDTAQALSQLTWLNWTFSTPLVAQGLGCSIHPYSMFGSFNLTSAPQTASVGKEKDCGLRNQHSFLSLGQDLCAINYYESASRETRKGCEGNMARERELAKPKVLCRFSQGFCNNGPQTQWLLRTEIYCPIVLEARNLKRRCWQGCALGEDPSLPIPAFGSPRHSLAYNSITSVSVWVFTWPASYVSLFLCPNPFMRTSVIMG